MKRYKAYIALLLAAAVTAGTYGCGGNISDVTFKETDSNFENPSQPVTASLLGGDLMADVSPGIVSGRQADPRFIKSMAGFSIELFKESITDSKNSLISPLSVMIALSMTANGAGSETLAQMEALLGRGIPLAELNEYLYAYAGSLPNEEKSTLNIASSIWFRDDDALLVYDGFLQKNADYYGAAAYKEPFDEQTLNAVNKWVEEKTDGMIDEILDGIDADDIMYLINAVMFDAEWQNAYFKESIREGIFTDIGGAEQKVDFMHSEEHMYIEDSMATGFIKPYANGGYSFAALLPRENVPIEAYIESLTGEGFLGILESARETTVFASMPKFEYEYKIEMNNALETLGMPDAFDVEKADFGDMAEHALGNIYIDMVLHKTFISVDELGTKAGAVTMVMMDAAGMPLDTETVNLDRPFVFAIVDNATNLPVFIGTLMSAL